MPCMPRKIRLLDYCIASSQCTLVRAAKHDKRVPVVCCGAGLAARIPARAGASDHSRRCIRYRVGVVPEYSERTPATVRDGFLALDARGVDSPFTFHSALSLPFHSGTRRGAFRCGKRHLCGAQKRMGASADNRRADGCCLDNAGCALGKSMGSRCRVRRHGLSGSRRLAHPCRTAIAQIRALTGSSAGPTPEALKPAATPMPCQPGVTFRGPYVPLCHNRPTNRIRHARRPLPAHS